MNQNQSLPILFVGDESSSSSSSSLSSSHNDNDNNNSLIKRVALLGPTASRQCNCLEATSSLTGSHSFPGAHVVTLEEALEQNFPTLDVKWSRGGTTAAGPTTSTIVNQTKLNQAIALARDSDLTLLLLGDVQGGCGEWQD